jgi:hypothetical protein
MSGNSTSEQKTSQATSNSFDPWVTSAVHGRDAGCVRRRHRAGAGPSHQQAGDGRRGPGHDGGERRLQVDHGLDQPERLGGELHEPLHGQCAGPDHSQPQRERRPSPAAHRRRGVDGGRLGRQRKRARTILEQQGTHAAYGKAFDSATAARTSALQTLLAATGGEQSSGAQAGTQSNTLATLLAGLGGQEQQANQTGINTAIGVNTSNQAGQLSQDTSLAQILAMVPKNTQGMSNGTNTSTTPDNSGMALLGSVLGKLI